MPSDVSIRITTKDASQADLRKAGQELDALGGKAKSAATGFSALSARLGGIRGLIGGLGIGLGISGLKSFVSEAHRTNLALEGMRNTLEFATGSAEKGGAAWSFVRGEVKRLGLDLESAGTEFSKFAAAARRTSIEGEGTRKIFSAISEAAAVLNLSSEQTSGALNALQQMLSKGTVAAEELRGQLGERIPGAFAMAADAMGVTTAELGKMLEQGQIAAEDLLPKLAEKMHEAFGERAAEAAKKTRGEIGRLGTAWTELKAAIGEPISAIAGTGAAGLIKVFNQWTEDIGTIKKYIEFISARSPTTLEGAVKLQNTMRATIGLAPLQLPPAQGPQLPQGPRLPFPGELEIPRRLQPPALTAAQLKAEEEFEAEVFGAAKSAVEAERDAAKKSAEEQLRSLLKVRELRIDLLRLKGDEIGALELERDAQIKAAATGEEKAQLLMVFEQRLLKAREAAHQRVMEMIAEELQAGKDFADEEERHRREVLDERQQDAQDILEARNKTETDARQAQLDKWRQQDEDFEREAQGQLAELADQWRTTGGQMEDVIDRFFGRFTSGLSGLRGEFSDFGDFLLDLLSSIGGQAAKEFLGEKAKGLLGRITGFLGDLIGIKRGLPGPGQPGGTQGPPQQGQATPAGAGLIQGGASIAALAGQFIPGRAGAAISGAGSGALLGFQLGGGPTPTGLIGAGIGAVAGGLLGGIFGGGDKQKDPVRAQIKQWVSTQLWPALQELKRLGFGPGGFGSFAPSGTDFFKGLGFESGIPQQLLADMKRMADAMKSIISEALQRGFASFSISAGWERFLRNIRRGLADYIGDAFRDAIVRGGLLSQAIAPFVQETARLTKRFRKGRISGPELESGILASFAQALPGIEALEPIFERLAGISRTITSQVSGQPRGTFITVPVTVHANIASGLDARSVGENLAYGIEMKLKQAMALGIA